VRGPSHRLAFAPAILSQRIPAARHATGIGSLAIWGDLKTGDTREGFDV